MKKIITLGALICTLSHSTMSGMLKCIKHIPARRMLIQKRYHVGAQQPKNIFTIDTASEPKDKVYGHLENLYDRNNTLIALLKDQKQSLDGIEATLKTQNDLAVGALHVGSVNISPLAKQERILRLFLENQFRAYSRIQQCGSKLTIKARKNSNDQTDQ